MEPESLMYRVREEVHKSEKRRAAHRDVMHTKTTSFLGDPPNDPPIDIFLAAAKDDLKMYQQAMQCSDTVAWDSVRVQALPCLIRHR